MSLDSKISKNFKISLLAILSLVLILFVFDLINYTSKSSDKIKEEGRITGTQLNINLETFIKEVEAVGEKITDQISSGQINSGNIEESLNQTLKFEHDVSSIGLLFAPYSFDKTLRLYSPYVIQKGNETILESFDSFYDYTTKSVPWYENSLNQESSWTTPFSDEISNDEFVYFTKPFEMKLPNGNYSRGLLILGVKTDTLSEKISSMNLDYLGQSYIVTMDEVHITSPIDLERNLRLNAQNIVSSDTRLLRVNDKNSDETIYVFATQLDSNGWTIIFDIIESEVLGDYSSYRMKVINVIIAFSLLITVIALVFLKELSSGYKPSRLYWVISIPLFCIFIIGSVYISIIGLEYQDKTEKEQNAIVNKSLLEDFKLEYIQSSLHNHDSPPIFIPTGLFIESVDFNTTGVVTLKGIIWQKYFNGIHDDVERNVSFLNSNEESLNKFFEKEFEDYTLVEWVFNIKVNSDFDYAKYPFSYENLWLQLKHKEFDRNIVLIPDLDSYKLGSTRYLPGLDKNITIRNWAIDNTYFSYTYDSYNTNFGIKNFIGLHNFPEIYFNIIITPKILNVFITNFLPIAIALFLIYGIFKTATGHYVVRPCATLFLALIFLQISLRRNLGANEIVYIEYYYFLTYFIMVGVSLNAVLLQNSKLWIVQYKNNIISKLIFWPFTGLAILILNILVFYN